MELERFVVKRGIVSWGVYDDVAKQWVLQNLTKAKAKEEAKKRNK